MPEQEMQERKDSLELKKAYAYCEAIIKEHSKSFYYAFSRLPKAEAKAVYAIYAFCRSADDSVDEVSSTRQQIQNIDRLEAALRRFEEGEETNHPIWLALRDVFDRYEMDIQPFYDQITGQKMDIEFVQPQDMEELETYSYYVAGSVGLMLLPVLSADRSEEVQKSAVSLGIAMQLTNILRDVGEDLQEKERIYLPKELMGATGVTEDDLKTGQVSPAFKSLWEVVAERSEELYDELEQALLAFDADARLPVLASALIYREIMQAVREKGYDCLTKRRAVSTLRKEQLYRQAKRKIREYERVNEP